MWTRVQGVCACVPASTRSAVLDWWVTTGAVFCLLAARAAALAATKRAPRSAPGAGRGAEARRRFLSAPSKNSGCIRPHSGELDKLQKPVIGAIRQCETSMLPVPPMCPIFMCGCAVSQRPHGCKVDTRYTAPQLDFLVALPTPHFICMSVTDGGRLGGLGRESDLLDVSLWWPKPPGGSQKPFSIFQKWPHRKYANKAQRLIYSSKGQQKRIPQNL